MMTGTSEIRWIDEYLFDDDASRARFRSEIAGIYRPHLRRLGTTFKDGEHDDTQSMRMRLLGFFARTLEDADVRKMLAVQGDAVLGLGDDRSKLDTLPRDLRGLAIVVAVQDHGKPAFEAVERQLRGQPDAELRWDLLFALGSTRDPRLAERARQLLLEPDFLRKGEISWVLDMQATIPAGRKALRQWIDLNFDALKTKLAPVDARLVKAYAAGMCSRGDIDELQRKFGLRVKTMEGGALTLQQLSESIRLCEAKLAVRRGQVPALAAP